MTNTEKLKQALALICEVNDSLDLRKSECACCGLAAYANRTHWQRGQTLQSIATKLERIVRGNPADVEIDDAA